ncbi:ABC transporter permease [Pseudoalteromonas luteoviolacea]|nr:ABC transporter permease [Pseudoalteromonas luteoviolacea]MBQ4876334.1 ABC transporter permease [Pseudoalteromonas luteoviolacea]MBQ4906367.1 ABC transporter permease [Pseudoalteromonas luteoviolacea]
MLIFILSLSGSAFFSAANLLNILLQTAPVAVMAIGLSFALSVGYIDLSIGAIVVICGMAAAFLLPLYGLPVAVVFALSLGVCIGAINGYLCERFALPPLIVTLGMLGVLTGFARKISDLQSIPIIHTHFITLFGHGSVLGVPIFLLWLAGLVMIAALIMTQTRFGRHLFAVGVSSSLAHQMGLNVSRVRMIAMSLCGGFCAFAGLLYAARMQSAKYTIGESDLMVAIAAVIIGGCSLLGGKVNIFAVVLGVWLLGCINNALIFSGFSSNEQMMVKGGILIVAVTITTRAQKS